MFLVYLIGCVAMQVWAWRSLIKRLRGGTITRLQSASRYAGWAFLPVLLFVGGFVAMVGIEEWLHVAFVEERAALLAFPVFGLSVLGTVAFTVRCAFLRRRQDTA
jgi:hypothetical protein